jgi:molybdopterin-binding protein
VRTPGGHHRIPRSEIERLGGGALAGDPSGLGAISGRNKLAGVVRRIRTSGLLSEVTIAVGDQTLTAIITKAAVQELRLRVGAPAVALIKATEVMVIKA